MGKIIGKMRARSIDVTAPATLEAGFIIDCEVDGRMISVTVPNGGVKEGQIFTVLDDPEQSPLVVETAVSTVYEPPRGAWKDGLFDIFALGCFHPSCCVSTWFHGCIGLAQLMERMNLNWFADPETPTDSPSKTFIIVILITAVLGALQISFVSFIFIVILATKTRKHIRQKYEIAATCFDGLLEDIFCSCFCSCCSIAQMLRHTANADNVDCCSPTGLRGDPQIV